MAPQITLFHLRLRFICLHGSKESDFGRESVEGISLLSNCSAETKSVIFLSGFGSSASFRPLVRKANVTEKCMRNANLFSFHISSSQKDDISNKFFIFILY